MLVARVVNEGGGGAERHAHSSSTEIGTATNMAIVGVVALPSRFRWGILGPRFAMNTLTRLLQSAGGRKHLNIQMRTQ